MDQDSKNVINELMSSSFVAKNELWKGTELFLWNASSTEKFTNGIKKTHDEHPITNAIWDVSKSKVRNTMDTLFLYDLKDESVDFVRKNSISNWLWEHKIVANIKLDTVKVFLRQIKVSKPPIELYMYYAVALEFQQQVSISVKKTDWLLSDSNISEKSILHYCRNCVDTARKKTFIVQLAKLYFPNKALKAPAIVNKNKSKLLVIGLHPYLDKFNKHLLTEGNTRGYIDDIYRDVMLFLHWATKVYSDFNDFLPVTIPIWLIQREHLIEYENHLKRCYLNGQYTEITVSNKFYCVLSFFKHLYHTRVISKNIGSVEGIKAERYLYRDVPNEEQISQFFTAIVNYSDEPKFDLAFFGALLHLGLRFCEADRLQWCDINFQAKVIKIRGKGKANKPVPLFLPQKLQNYLEALPTRLNNQKFVFKENQSLYRKMLDKYKLYAMISGWNFPGGLHLFRHTFITTLSRRKNIHPQLVQRLARHDRIETTSKYLHRKEQELDDAMKIIDTIWS
ncbi:site-specific integrase [Paenibacillus sp. P46E]|uniref:tyrosine-type recombinase/integrase n=1 Tax=Paenibacillus sp. P46E TaxID=1349436 RepID=UPI0009390A64|nr:site-specific integrase [Paenibacillus sp. P46E]OKP95023.1 hypothetical protein A3849_28260 [Paenibacillus sp. P46E]